MPKVMDFSQLIVYLQAQLHVDNISRLFNVLHMYMIHSKEARWLYIFMY